MREIPWRRWMVGGWLCLGLGLAGCGGSSDPDGAGPPAGAAEIQVLMLGNSHSSHAGLDRRLEAMLGAGLKGRSVAVTVAPGLLFLDERLRDPASLALLRSRRWTAVVLQAQKYSTTGLYDYSTAEAQTLAAEARALGALPVLFPEWPRRGVDETARIYGMHVRIASAAPACLAPVGQAFDLARSPPPSLTLHASDGNHAAPAGAQLAALVLYAALSGGSPKALPDTAADLDSATQARLRDIAAEAVAAHPPRPWCPGDAPWLR